MRPPDQSKITFKHKSTKEQFLSNHLCIIKSVVLAFSSLSPTFYCILLISLTTLVTSIKLCQYTLTKVLSIQVSLFFFPVSNCQSFPFKSELLLIIQMKDRTLAWCILLGLAWIVWIYNCCTGLLILFTFGGFCPEVTIVCLTIGFFALEKAESEF